MQGVSFDEVIFFFGGCSKFGNDYLNETYTFDPINLSWKKLDGEFSPSARIDFGISIISGKRGVLFGGSDGYLTYSDTYLFDLSKLVLRAESLSWTEIETKKCPSSRFGHSQVVFEDRIYLFGGWDGKSTLNDIWEFDIMSKSWNQILKYSNVAPRYRHSAISFKNFMVVFGGVDHYQIRYFQMK